MMEKTEHLGLGGAHSPLSRFGQHTRAIGVLWGVFSVCFSIIVIVVFIQPHWIGIGKDGGPGGPGHMGLWRWCRRSYSPLDAAREVTATCSGELQDIVDFSYDSRSNPAFKAASLLTALAVLLTMLCVAVMLLFLCLKANTVFYIAGCIQIIAGVVLGAAVAVYPAGFSSIEVISLCGPTARAYNTGWCNVRWAYVLAIIGVFDSIVLASLALILANYTLKARQDCSAYNGAPELYKGGDYMTGGAMTADGASLAASRKSLNLQPVMMMPPSGGHPDQPPYSHPHHYQL